MTLEERKQIKEEYLKKIREIEKEERKEVKKAERAEREKVNAFIKKSLGISLSDVKNLLKEKESFANQKNDLEKLQNEAAAWNAILAAYNVKNGAEAQAVYDYIRGQNIVDFYYKNARQE